MSSEAYGTLLVFDTADALLAAVRQLRRAGFARLQAYAPHAVDGLDEALGLPRNRIARIAFAAGVLGGIGTLGMEYYAAVFAYPIRVGGRPFASWPAFIPAALEMTLLFAAAAGVLAMLRGSGLPRFYHPAFHAAAFHRISQDRFAVLVRADKQPVDENALLDALQHLRPIQLQQVPA